MKTTIISIMCDYINQAHRLQVVVCVWNISYKLEFFRKVSNLRDLEDISFHYSTGIRVGIGVCVVNNFLISKVPNI